jgi:hypothetical protein
MEKNLSRAKLNYKGIKMKYSYETFVVVDGKTIVHKIILNNKIFYRYEDID